MRTAFLRRSWLVLLLLLFLSYRVSGAQEVRTDTSRTDSVRLPDPTGAMIRSWVFPGWGQWYNGKKWKAGLVFAAETGLAAYAVYQNWLAANESDPTLRFYYEDRRNLALWWLAGIALFSGLDAYVDAHLAGFDVSEDLTLRPETGSHFGVRVELRLDMFH